MTEATMNQRQPMKHDMCENNNVVMVVDPIREGKNIYQNINQLMTEYKSNKEKKATEKEVSIMYVWFNVAKLNTCSPF